MHNVPTLSHGAPLTYNHGNQPTQQGIEPPQQQRHYQHYRDHDQSGLSCFLTTRPYDLANLDARFLSKTKEGLPLGRLQSQEGSDHRQNENTENAIQDWLSRKVLIAHNGNHNQNGNQEPFQEIKT
ncbi:Uncharacterised protein [Pseudomonas aeruginosa]|nr:hypothetical protein HMPREF1030_06014 [Pseudomonas aeruginosa]ERX48723.1 hypothetical protein Q002_04875 [Pseudomonas aeruginosa CF18]ERY68013.1 hypothetical protein Q057_02313 [Pseudomonas aeruginosa BL03]WBH34750.1 hypothetical protein PALA4_03427 [Pseudomonas aeruginosa]SUD00118.1 Uncharacterised protein [Pseudomonas aeruginosa]